MKKYIVYIVLPVGMFVCGVLAGILSLHVDAISYLENELYVTKRMVDIAGHIKNNDMKNAAIKIESFIDKNITSIAVISQNVDYEHKKQACELFLKIRAQRKEDKLNDSASIDREPTNKLLEEWKDCHRIIDAIE